MTQLETLKAELNFSKVKMIDLQNWLIDHTQHPDFMLIAGDRNHLSVKIQAIEFKIDQLEKGLPILGQPEELKGGNVNLTTIQIEKIQNTLIR